MSSLSQSADKLRILVTPSIPESPSLEDAENQIEKEEESIFQKKAQKTVLPDPSPDSPIPQENKKVRFTLDDIVEQDKKIAEKIEQEEEKIIEKQVNKPKRKKRAQTQKQKDALARGRAKALENRRRKAEIKKKEAEYRKLKKEEEMREKENYIMKEKLKKEALQREIFKLFERYETYKQRKRTKSSEKNGTLPQKTALISKKGTQKRKSVSLPKSMKKDKPTTADPFSHFFS